MTAASRAAQPLVTPGPPHRLVRVLVGTDFWGAGNLGDDLVLAGFAAWLAQARPAWSVSILCAHDRDAMRLRFPQFEWMAADEATRRTALSQTDLWVGLGGSVFQTDEGPWLLERIAADLRVATQHQVPAVLVGVGLNNDEAVNHPLAGEIVDRVQGLWVRDLYCHRVLQAAHPGLGTLRLGADIAHLAFEEAAAAPLAGSAACLIAPPEQVNAQAVIEALHDDGLMPTWFCQEVRSLPGSEASLHACLPAALQARAPLRRPDYGHATLEQLVSAMCGFSAVLTSRYHMALASAWSGARVAVFDRNAKLTGIREELGLAECATLRSREAIAEALRRSRPADRARLHACATRAQRMFNELSDFVRALPEAHV